MTNLKKRERAKTNASLISMVQRFSDITIMFAGLWLVCEVSGLSFLYMHLLVALITLVSQHRGDQQQNKRRQHNVFRTFEQAVNPGKRRVVKRHHRYAVHLFEA